MNQLNATNEEDFKSTKWLVKLNNIASVDNLRQQLQTYHPGVNPSELSKVIIFGAAEEGQRLVSICQQRNIQIVALCDDNELLTGASYHGVKVQKSTAILNCDKSIPVIVATHRVLKPMRHLKEAGFTNVVPFAFLQVLQPSIFKPHMFYENWYEDMFNNKDKIFEVRDLLEDVLSNNVLDAILGFRMTMDPSILDPIIEWELYGPYDLLDYTDSEVYIDGGTFDGDSIKLFMERVNNKFERIIGFEPDTNTYQKLVENVKFDSRIEAVNKGLYDKEQILHFDNAGTRGSIFVETESNDAVEVPVTSIDQYLQGDRVSFIKMNIEGAELAALEGARHSIQKYLPKLGISIYHRASDLWEIPLFVKSIVPSYKLFFRQHDGGVIESVLYAKH